ncbi:MAG TPA: PVC-type heme-binding CxxCH protein [Pirellulaceae bacterium]|jgi:putative membrane-bound dehydrogenase-like protein|nr:PVC-type heme-binding CxxCH protein [Pirellulaceae bacterium]
MRSGTAALTALLACSIIGAALAEEPSPHPTIDGPLTPAEAPASFELEPGLRVELVAGEPLVDSPVAMAFDERGRLFVAENRDYPTGPKEGEPPDGRVAQLIDDDGDGRVDRRQDFATGLTFPNGILPYAGGLIVTCAPDVLFLADRDGDGTAEERRVLLTGFATTGSTQLRVSHPTLGPDGWIYLTSGLTGGEITSPEHPERPPVAIKRTDLRFRFDDLVCEPAGGGSQFGMTFDDFGRRFICYNRVQVQHVVLSEATLARHPKLAFSKTVHDCPAEMLGEPLKGHGAAARLFPISANVTTADSHAGAFTAACGVHVYRGTGLPERYRGGVFSCDPTANLVHFDALEPDGATFAARRIAKETEFLRSSDGWFRPVFVTTGPDGALYVADMYRKTIEHPDYLPVEIRKRTDFHSGKGMGRIWRVIDESITPADRSARFAANLIPEAADEAALVAALDSPEGWRRDTAHRLLRGRELEGEAVEALKRLVQEAKHPAAAAQALELLNADDAVAAKNVLLSALDHPSNGVREVAVRLLTPAAGKDQQIANALVAIDPPALDPRARFMLAIALGEVAGTEFAASERAVARLAAIYAQAVDDSWTQAAVLSGLAGREQSFLRDLLHRFAGSSERSNVAWLEIGRFLGNALPVTERGHAVRLALEAERSESADALAFLVGFGDSVRSSIRDVRRKNPTEALPAAVAFGLDDQASTDRLAKFVGEAAKIAQDATADVDARGIALRTLGLGSYDASAQALTEALAPSNPSELRSAAAKTLTAFGDPRAGEILFDQARFASYSPALRDEILDAALSDAGLTAALVAALESDAVPVAAIDSTRRRRLAGVRDESVRARAEKLFGAVSGDRAAIYEELKSAAEAPGDAEKGRVAFRRECSTCHRLDREGYAVGPDLFGIRNQPKASILLHILAPDHEITAGFGAYQVVTDDGRSFVGLLAADSPTSVTLRMPQGKEESFLRSEIELLVASKNSLMPSGFEKTVAEKEFADLLAYLKGEGPASPPAEEP